MSAALLQAARDAMESILGVHASFGAPGDYGYSTKEGKALFSLYKSGNALQHEINEAMRADASKEASQSWTGWLPISDAQKNGEIFIALTARGICRCKWGTVDWGEHPLDPIHKWWIDIDENLWFEDGPHDAPTHWMPYVEPQA